MQLLAVYKVFRPELVTHTLPSRMKVSVSILKSGSIPLVTVGIFTSDLPACLSVWFQTGFKNYNSTWKAALSAVQKGNMAEVIAHPSLSVALKSKSTSRKRVRCAQSRELVSLSPPSLMVG